MSATLDDLVVALEKAPIGVLVLKRGRIAWLNEALAELVGQTKAELIGRPLLDSPLAAWQGTLVEVSTAAGPRWLQRHLVALAAGEVLYFQDLTEAIELRQTVAELRARLASLETADPVTGLLNQRAIRKELDRQISRSRRYANPLAVIRLTLEAEGAPEYRQERLRAFGRALKDKLRWADEIGVLEPNTFLLVLPETSLDDAKQLAVKLLSDRAAFQLQDGEKVRCGVAAWEKGDDPGKLLKRAQEDQDLDLSALLS
ncbi:hypothetical protein JCM13664_20600 [Methylothermus subterraneus]